MIKSPGKLNQQTGLWDQFFVLANSLQLIGSASNSLYLKSVVMLLFYTAATALPRALDKKIQLQFDSYNEVYISGDSKNETDFDTSRAKANMI